MTEHEIRTKNAVQFLEAGGSISWSEWKLISLEDRVALLEARDEILGAQFVESQESPQEHHSCEEIARRLVS